MPDAPVPQPRQGAKSAFVTKVQQIAGEFAFPSFFGLIPWMLFARKKFLTRLYQEPIFYLVAEGGRMSFAIIR